MTSSTKKALLSLVVIYSSEYGERVIRNLVNDPSFCKPCGLYCDYCKFGVYSHVRHIYAAIPLPIPSELPPVIETGEEYLPQKIPQADLCIASGIHQDVLLELPLYLKKHGVKGLVVPIEDFREVPSGVRRQVQDLCQELALESAFPKPFCSLEPHRDIPTISRLITELYIGRPSLEIYTTTRTQEERIEATIVRQSAPCGSTWYIAKQLIGVETTPETLYDAVARAYHSYPCTATMSVDPEAKEPILHIGGHIIRDEVKKALANTG